MAEVTKLFQYNTLAALMAGLYDGTITVGELLEHGDLGIGTLDSIDGELIVFDGKAYQAKANNSVVKLENDVKVPYAAVVPHKAEVIFKKRFQVTNKELEAQIESYFDGKNLFRSIKVDGFFSKIHVRMIPRSKEGVKFVEASKHQPEFFGENVRGTVVGFWTPRIFNGISVGGFHLHFISDDLTFGGHLLDFVMDEGEVELGAIDQFDLLFPVQDKKFLFKEMDLEKLASEIEEAEK